MKKIISNCLYYFGLLLLAIIILIGNISNGILLSMLSIFVIYLFVNKVKINKFPLFLIIFCLITKIICVLILKTPLVADYWIMYEAAQNMLENNYSFVNKLYFLTWGYQLFHVFYEFIIFKIINDVMLLKILNCIYSTVITVMLYLITKKITNEKTARITSLLYSISIYPLFLNSVIGNQQLGLMLMMIAIYILMYKENKISNLIIIGLLIGISNLERAEGIIYILTIIIYFIISNEKLREIIKKSFIILFTYFLVTRGASYLLVKTGFNEIGFNNKNPYWKFITGFSYETNGKYNINDEYYSDINNLELEKKEVLNRVKQIDKWPKLFYEKTKIIWLYEDSEECFNVKNMNLDDDFTMILINYMKFMNVIILFLAFIGIYKNKNISSEVKFFLINVIIYFGVYLLIEVQIRYYFNPQLSIFVLSSLGIEKILKKIE